jgi:pimeloyl-ACP methyl ester carboxylesterase
MKLRVFSDPLIAVLLMVLSGLTLHGQSSSTPIESTAACFVTDEDYIFDAKIVAPAEPFRNGFGILMIGGGLGNDLDWTAPGFVNYFGKKQQITITGESHTDAPIIAEELAKRGFVVMHYTTIRRDDPKRDEWPNEVTHYSPQDLLRFSKSALATLRAQLGAEDKIILIGHSLGAVRAANIAAVDNKLTALVLLAPAQLTRTSDSDRGQNSNRDAAMDFLRAVDKNGDDTCGPDEFKAWKLTTKEADHTLASQLFKSLDFHSDNRLVEWEISAGFARVKRRQIDFDSANPVDRFGLFWTEDVLRNTKLDTLLVFGALDSAQSHHAPIVAELINAEKLGHVQLKVLSNLGHQLGNEKNNLVGPISEEALRTIAGWLETRIQ